MQVPFVKPHPCHLLAAPPQPNRGWPGLLPDTCMSLTASGYCVGATHGIGPAPAAGSSPTAEKAKGASLPAGSKAAKGGSERTNAAGRLDFVLQVTP